VSAGTGVSGSAVMDVLHITALRKAYRTPEGDVKTIVDIPSFRLEAGAAMGLKGGSGSGKTTFLHLIAGLVRPDAGSILLDGVELTKLGEGRRDRLRATTLGCVYQSFNLLPGYTCLENVTVAMAFGAGRDRTEATRLLQRVGLGHRLNYSPHQLSAGQQQRVAVARALANRPKLVLADEPTGNLDPELAAETLTLLRETCAEQQAALLLVSHDAGILGGLPRVMEFSRINAPLAVAPPAAAPTAAPVSP